MSDEQRRTGALVIYWSATGNTTKVADRIEDSLRRGGVDVATAQISENLDIDFYDYDMVFFGTPTYGCLPPGPVIKFIKNKLKQHAKNGDVKMGAPLLPGKHAAVFCTYSGPHTGLGEAIPVGKYTGQLFEHIGFEMRSLRGSTKTGKIRLRNS